MRYPSEFQRKVFNTLAILGLSQVQVQRDHDGTFTLNTSALWKRFLYFLFRFNTVCKFIFLVLLSCGVFQEDFEFFEKMAILLWFLIFFLVSISERIFYQKHPFFEILTAWWKVEESVYLRLGRPSKFLKDLRWIALWRVWFQGVIAAVGILAVYVQYDAAPKYCVFAYSIIEKEDNLLKLLFGIHEIIFLVHAWLVYGSVIYLSSVIGAEFTYNVKALQQVLEMFTNGMISDRRSRLEDPSQMASDPLSSLLSMSSSQQQALTSSSLHNKSSKRVSNDLSSMLDNYTVDDDNSLVSLSRRVEYDILGVIREYLHVHMVVTRLNAFASNNFLYMHGCSYVQMVSDVFQMIQILRGPDADFLAVLFFAEDMLVCMYMLFRCFKSMAFLQPSSVSFLEKFRDLLASSSPSPSIKRRKHVFNRADRQLLIKIRPTLHITAFKLGPCTVGPWTVGIAMDVLLQYYICVALWK